MNRILYPILGFLLLVATVAQVYATRTKTAVAPQTAQLAKSPRVVAEGRVVTYPGAEVTVGTDVSGTIEKLNVEEKDVVKKGDVIAVIKAHDTRAALSVARARVGEAEADIKLFEAEVARAQHLFREDVGSQHAWDKADRDLDAAPPRLASAASEVRRLEALVGKTIITAPIDGVVIARAVHAGETVAEGDELLTIANLDKTRVEAEIDEYDVARMQLGATVKVTAEGFARGWKGTIEEIPDSVVNRRLKPQDPSKPIDTRVLLVKVAFAEETPLKLGQRVEVRIDGH